MKKIKNLRWTIIFSGINWANVKKLRIIRYLVSNNKFHKSNLRLRFKRALKARNHLKMLSMLRKMMMPHLWLQENSKHRTEIKSKKFKFAPMKRFWGFKKRLRGWERRINVWMKIWRKWKMLWWKQPIWSKKTTRKLLKSTSWRFKGLRAGLKSKLEDTLNNWRM